MNEALGLDQDFVGSASPFLKFVMFYHNHSPHWCEDEFAGEYGTENFIGNPQAMQTCLLREYDRRAKDSERAVAIARDCFEQLQAKTGRPYVIAIYGDHQPHSFTGTGGVRFTGGLSFETLRADKEKRRTILQIISSAENPLNCCGDVPAPLTLFPSLISAYVAESPDKLYLPENFYQFDRCGSDIIGQMASGNFNRISDEGHQNVCSAFEEILAALKASDVIGNSGAPGSALATVPTSVVAQCDANSITVEGGGSYFEGGPEIAVIVDDKDIGHIVLDDDSSNKMTDPANMIRDKAAPAYRLPLPAGTTAQKIEIKFLNDHWGGTGKDRNANIHNVSLNSTALDSHDVLFSDEKGGWRNPNGVIQLFRNSSVTFNGPFAFDCPK